MAITRQTEVRYEDGYYRKYYITSAADLVNLPVSPVAKIGSTAEAENGAVYRLNNANAWAIYSPASSVSSAVAIDQTTANANVVAIKTNAGKSTGAFTRPDNTTAYAANDVVGATEANITFANVLGAAQLFIITGASLRIDAAAIPAGMGGFKLYLFDAAPTAIADNAAFNLIAADRAKLVGVIQIATPVDVGDTLWSQNDNINLNGKLVTTSLYGVLVTDNAYTPTAQCVKTITLYTIGV